METDLNWNSKVVNVLRLISKQCFNYKKSHHEMAMNSERKYSYLMFLSIGIAPLSGTISSIGSAVCDNINEYFYYSTTSAVLSFLSGILVSILKFGKYDKISNSHTTAFVRYNSLENNIRRQLLMPATERVNARKYLSWAVKQFDDLYTSSPILPDDILNEYTEFEELYQKQIEKYGDVETLDPVKFVDLKKIKKDKNETSYMFSRYQDSKKFDDESILLEIRDT